MKKIPLTLGLWAKVDDDDFAFLSQYKWQARRSKNGRTVYASHAYVKNGKVKNTQMSRMIMNPPKDKLVDHINHDGIDNRRSNLRICTDTENNRNMSKSQRKLTSKYKGVLLHKDKSHHRNKQWRAQIREGKGKIRYLGYFWTEKEAAIAYNRAAQQLFGEFAFPNLI